MENAPLSQSPLDTTPKFEPSKTFQLSTPVKHGTSMVSEITLRTPKGLDLFEVGGLPSQTLWTQGSMTVKMDTPVFQSWLTRLSEYPMPVFYQVPAGDLRAMYQWLIDILSASGN